MTDTKHTPGPWVVTQDNKGSLDDYCIGTGQRIDEVATCSKRDAHLIAAAPDLLESLELALEYMGYHNGEYDCQDKLDLINAAIAKAKGKTE